MPKYNHICPITREKLLERKFKNFPCGHSISIKGYYNLAKSCRKNPNDGVMKYQFDLLSKTIVLYKYKNPDCPLCRKGINDNQDQGYLKKSRCRFRRFTNLLGPKIRMKCKNPNCNKKECILFKIIRKEDKKWFIKFKRKKMDTIDKKKKYLVNYINSKLNTNERQKNYIILLAQHLNFCVEVNCYLKCCHNHKKNK